MFVPGFYTPSSSFWESLFQNFIPVSNSGHKGIHAVVLVTWWDTNAMLTVLILLTDF